MPCLIFVDYEDRITIYYDLPLQAIPTTTFTDVFMRDLAPKVCAHSAQACRTVPHKKRPDTVLDAAPYGALVLQLPAWITVKGPSLVLRAKSGTDPCIWRGVCVSVCVCALGRIAPCPPRLPRVFRYPSGAHGTRPRAGSATAVAASGFRAARRRRRLGGPLCAAATIACSVPVVYARARARQE